MANKRAKEINEMIWIKLDFLREPFIPPTNLEIFSNLIAFDFFFLKNGVPLQDVFSTIRYPKFHYSFF